MKWETDLVKDIRTFTDFDDQDGGVPHPLGYGSARGEGGEYIYPIEVTDCNRISLLQNFMKVRDNCKAILEIGIGRNSKDSFAYVFFNSKKKDTVYIGLDIEDRTFLDDRENNIHTLLVDSSDYEENVKKFKELGVEKFDFIFIDGWHSINQVLKDWEYSNLLSDDGIIGFHDTSCHPGPYNFIRALDPDKWNIEANMCPNDWGVGFVSKNLVKKSVKKENNFILIGKNPKPKSKLKDFPNVYYISLEESSDRRESLEKSFSDYGIQNLTPIISKRFSESGDKVSGEQLHILDGGTIGCVVSHLKMIRKWYEETTDEYAFFCEDDLSLETIKDWNFTWKDFINHLPSDWECVQLCCIRPSHDDVSLKDRSMYDWSVTAYIMKRSYARKIIDRHCFDDEYKLDIPGTNFYPMPETVLFYDVGRVYAVDLFVEDQRFNSTFTETENIEGGTKEYHAESHDYVKTWWEQNGQNVSIQDLLGAKSNHPKTELEELLTKYSLDTENPTHNFNLGIWYENSGHTAPALSYYLRCAERADDKDLAYEALIRGSYCYDKQGTRDGSAKSLLQQALVLLPERPEAYFLLSRFAEKRQWWQDCYIYSDQALNFCDFDVKPLMTDVEYPGPYGLIFEKAVSSWWWGKVEECRDLFLDLLNNHDMNEQYHKSVLENLKLFGIDIFEKRNNAE